jgi:hypothetical protein
MFQQQRECVLRTISVILKQRYVHGTPSVASEIRQMLTFFCQSSLPESCPWAWLLLAILIVEYHRKTLSLNPTSSPELEPRTICRCCGLCLCNPLLEINNFGLGAVLLSCLVSELQKPPLPGIEPRTVFGVLIFIFVTSSSKQTTLVLAPFFYRA